MRELTQSFSPHFPCARDRATTINSEPQRRAKVVIDYCPLKTALRPFKWSGMTKMQTKLLQPPLVFAVLGEFFYFVIYFCLEIIVVKALWEFQSRHNKTLPDNISHCAELESIASAMFNAADVNKVIKSVPKDLIE